MNTNASLGPLVYAVIEQYGDLARTAVASAIGRRQAACLAGNVPFCTIAGHLYTDHELALQQLQPGNWLTVGLAGDGTENVMVEINLTTEAIRERAVPRALAGKAGHGRVDLPAPPLASDAHADANGWDAA